MDINTISTRDNKSIAGATLDLISYAVAAMRADMFLFLIKPFEQAASDGTKGLNISYIENKIR